MSKRKMDIPDAPDFVFDLGFWLAFKYFHSLFGGFGWGRDWGWLALLASDLQRLNSLVCAFFSNDRHFGFRSFQCAHRGRPENIPAGKFQQ